MKLLLFWIILFSTSPSFASSDTALGPYQLKGQPTLVDFWASWCTPCLISFPLLQKIQVEYQGQVQFIAVNMDSDLKAKDRFLKKNPLSFLHVTDTDKELKSRFKVQALPTTLIFDSQGKEVFRLRGFDEGHEEKIRKALKDVLGPRS